MWKSGGDVGCTDARSEIRSRVIDRDKKGLWVQRHSSSVVMLHQPLKRWSLYQRYFPFCRLCVITCCLLTLRGMTASARHRLASNIKPLWQPAPPQDKFIPTAVKSLSITAICNHFFLLSQSSLKTLDFIFGYIH